MQLLIVVFFLSTILTIGQTILENSVAPPELVQKASPKTFKPKCKIVGPPLDLMIVFDSSGSLSSEFANNVQIIEGALDSVTIGQDATRVELIEFSGFAKVEFRFNQSLNGPVVRQMVAGLTNHNGITRTQLALKLALEELNPATGLRGSGVPKIILLISDGRCSDCDKPEPDQDVKYGQQLRDKGVEIWAFGTGDYAAVEQLAKIAGTWQHIYSKNNYTEMKEALKQRFKGTEVCEQVPVCIPGSDKPADILFVIDGSGSLSSGFGNEIGFVKRVLTPFYVHPDSARVSAIHYSTQAHVDFGFLQYRTNDEVLQAIKAIQPMATTTRTDLALQAAKELLLKDPGVRNASVPKIVIVLTDGYSHKDEVPDAEELLHGVPNVQLYAVAVYQQNVNEEQLQRMVGNRSNRVFTRSNLDSFETELKQYIGSPCPGVDLEGGSVEPYVRKPIETQCTENSVTLTVRTKNPFEGKLYAPGFFGDSSCMMSGDGKSTEVSLTLTPGKCGLTKKPQDNPQPGFALNGSAMIQFHPLIVTQSDQIIPMDCFVPSSSALQRIGEIKLPPMFTECSYKITKNNPDGCVVLDGTVGEYVVHSWTCDNGPDYDFLVRSCHAETPTGEKINFIDDNGCAIDKYMLEQPKYNSRNHQQVYREGYLYRFPKGSYIKFMCKISLCQKSTKECEGVVPPVCDKRQRRSVSDLLDRQRRRAATYVAEVDVDTRILTVIDSESTKPTHQNRITYCPANFLRR